MARVPPGHVAELPKRGHWRTSRPLASWALPTAIIEYVYTMCTLVSLSHPKEKHMYVCMDGWMDGWMYVCKYVSTSLLICLLIYSSGGFKGTARSPGRGLLSQGVLSRRRPGAPSLAAKHLMCPVHVLPQLNHIGILLLGHGMASGCTWTMIYDDAWWCMIIFDDVWWFKIMYDDARWYMTCIMIFREKRWAKKNIQGNLYWHLVAKAAGTKHGIPPGEVSKFASLIHCPKLVISINGGSPKWTVSIRKSHLNRWFRGTSISGNIQFLLKLSHHTHPLRLAQAPLSSGQGSISKNFKIASGR